MSRGMKFGIVTIVATFALSLLAPDDAEARHRRHRRHRCGCHGYTACCAPAPSCCGVVQQACPGGVCAPANGSHHAGYGATQNGQGQPTLPPSPAGADQSAPPPAPSANGAAAPPAQGATPSPSDRPAPPAGNGAAPPPPPQNQ